MPNPDLIGYRFRAVELDLVRMVLRVDGSDVAATPLPVKLLALLCERDGALCTRSEIFDAVWPRQDISDDALNKLISRLRELLGSSADAIVTVRKQGLRLDAPVERWLREAIDPIEVANTEASTSPTPAAGGPTAVEPESPPSPKAPPIGRSRRWLLRLIVAAATLMLVALIGWIVAPETRTRWAPLASDAVAFGGYALRLSDLRPGRPETIELVHAAELALDRGDSAQARRLLQSAEQADPGSAVLPALRLIHYGSDQSEPQTELARRARVNLNAQDSPYVRLLVDYATATDSDVERAAVDALLTLRPQAWRLRLRRAHIDIQNGNRDGALRQLRAIPLDQAPPPTLMYVLADRASYGDGTAVAAALQGGALAAAPLQRAYVEARLAWSARAADARARFETLADDAESAGAFALAAQARELAAGYAYAVGESQADARLKRAVYAVKQSGRAESLAPILALLADLAQSDGNSDEARTLLNQAREVSGPAGDRVELEIANARMGLLPRGIFLETAGGTDDRFGVGEPALIAGWYALRAGKPAQARAALAEARASGIERSPHAESAALLGVELGETSTGCWLDPPYPDLLRLASCRRLEQARTR